MLNVGSWHNFCVIADERAPTYWFQQNNDGTPTFFFVYGLTATGMWICTSDLSAAVPADLHAKFPNLRQLDCPISVVKADG